MAQLISQQFHAALCYLLKKEGRGAQSRLANQQKIDRGYLNGIAKGRKPGSEEVRSKIADYFKLSYDEMLLLGRRLLANENIEEENIQSMQTTGEDGEQRKYWEPAKGIQKVGVLSSEKQNETTREDIKISDLIKKTADILESDTTHRDALATMIETLHASLCKEKEQQEQQNQMREMEKRMQNLEKLLGENSGGQRKSA